MRISTEVIGMVTPAKMLAAVLVLGGCTAHAELSSTLSKVCPGSAVQLSWRTDGSTRLNLEPTPSDRPAQDSAVGRKGQLTFHPTQDTTAQLTVRRFLGHPVSAQWSIDVLEANPAPIWLTATFDDEKFEPMCRDGVLSANVSAAGFDPLLRAGVMSAYVGADRVLTVSHAGAAATIAPGDTNSAFASSSIDGAWHLETRLREGESCASATLPRSLTVGIQPTCGALR
ncbi:MAG TPA: hypothetical protein VI299_17470 [Polyangiales bacterium]